MPIMEQFEIKEKGDLLDHRGHINQAGYATHLIRNYDRKMVGAQKWRIKEWDYYYFGNEHFGVSLTVADNSYMGLVGVEVIDFMRRLKDDYSKISFFPMGRFNMSDDSRTGDISYEHKKIQVNIQSHETHKSLFCRIPHFNGDNPLELNVDLYYRNDDSMVIVTPFSKEDTAFYYNQKINNLEAKGVLEMSNRKYNLDEMMGVLDWGRGVWTYNNTWYWSSASGKLEDGSLFGFNLGYGFGDTSNATENMVFYKGKAYKLNDVDFGIPDSGFMEDTWHFTSEDKRIDMTFTPIYNNRDDINIGVLRHNPNQVFGVFNGHIEIEDRENITFNKLFGFAEKVHNKW